jgi:glycosyltransferase involved in cell wall biosynthesis
MKKLKIGILLISNGWSGAENAVYNLTKHLKKEHNEVTLFLNNEITKYYLDIKKIKLQSLGQLYSEKKYLWPLCFYRMREKISSYIKKQKIDILTIFLQDSSIVSFKLRNQLKIPIIINLRGLELESLRNRGKIINKYFLKNILYNSDLILSLGSWQLKYLSSKYKTKSDDISNGVDSKMFKPLKNIQQRNNVVFFTGRFMDIKGIRELLNVAKQLSEYEFWFAGQGPLADLINLSNTKNLGFKTTEELVKLYNQATICVFPSYSEAFGNVGIEAMSCGRAVIATPLGFSEYIENEKDGIIIPSKDEKSLKDAIVDLMENPSKRKELEKNARKKALNYTWDKVAKQYIKIYKKVIAEHKKKKS